MIRRNIAWECSWRTIVSAQLWEFYKMWQSHMVSIKTQYKNSSDSWNLSHYRIRPCDFVTSHRTHCTGLKLSKGMCCKEGIAFQLVIWSEIRLGQCKNDGRLAEHHTFKKWINWQNNPGIFRRKPDRLRKAYSRVIFRVSRSDKSF